MSRRKRARTLWWNRPDPGTYAGRVTVALYDPNEPDRQNVLILTSGDAEFLGNQLISVAQLARARMNPDPDR